MRIIKVPRVNALGKEGSEKAPDLILKEAGLKGEEVEIDNFDLEKSDKEIYEKAKEVFGEGGGVFVGGDHSISFPILRGFKEVYENCFLIVFDAHADCDFANKEPTHEEWLRAIVEAGWKPENIVLIGVRKMWDVEKKFLKEKGIKYFSANIDIEGVADYVTENAQGKDVYVSVDVDVFEPCVAPGVHYPESEGLSSKEFFYLWRRILHLPGLRGMDVVEVVPSLDEKYDYRTVKLGGKVLGGFFGRGLVNF